MMVYELFLYFEGEPWTPPAQRYACDCSGWDTCEVCNPKPKPTYINTSELFKSADFAEVRIQKIRRWNKEGTLKHGNKPVKLKNYHITPRKLYDLL